MSTKIKPEVAADVIAEQIRKISAGMKALQSSQLNEKAIHVLLWHACGRSVPAEDIRRVVSELENLEKTYLKQPKKER